MFLNISTELANGFFLFHAFLMEVIFFATSFLCCQYLHIIISTIPISNLIMYFSRIKSIFKIFTIIFKKFWNSLKAKQRFKPYFKFLHKNEISFVFFFFYHFHSIEKPNFLINWNYALFNKIFELKIIGNCLIRSSAYGYLK